MDIKKQYYLCKKLFTALDKTVLEFIKLSNDDIYQSLNHINKYVTFTFEGKLTRGNAQVQLLMDTSEEKYDLHPLIDVFVLIMVINLDKQKYLLI